MYDFLMFLNYLYLCFILEINKEKPKWNEIKQNNKKNSYEKQKKNKKMIENFRNGYYGKKKKELFISISSESLK